MNKALRKELTMKELQRGGPRVVQFNGVRPATVLDSADIAIDNDGTIIKHRWNARLVGAKAWRALLGEAVAPGEGWTAPLMEVEHESVMVGSEESFACFVAERQRRDQTAELHFWVGPVGVHLCLTRQGKAGLTADHCFEVAV